MQKYVKIHILEYFFIALASFGIALNTLSSFLIRNSLLSNYLLIALMVLAVDLVFFVLAYNKMTSIVGSAVLALLLIVAVLVLRSQGYLKLDSDIDKSVPLFIFVVFMSTALTFLCTRLRVLTIFYAVVISVLIAVFALLEYPVSPMGLIVMCVGLIFEILYRVYYEAIMKAAYGKYSFTHFLIQSTAILGITLIVSLSIFTFAIKPLRPQTHEIILMTKMMSFDILHVIGVSTTTEVEVPDNKTEDVNDEQRQTQNEEEKDNEQQKENSQIQQKQTDDSLTKKSQNQLAAFAIKYNQNLPLRILIYVLMFLLLLSPFLIKMIYIRSRNKKIESFSPNEGVMYLYKYFRKSFNHIGIKKPDSLTTYEYAKNTQEDMDLFRSNDGKNFMELTKIYNKTLYGTYAPTEEDYGVYKTFYYNYRKSAKAKIGKFKYMFKFWIL